jgi:hypothetical protein
MNEWVWRIGGMILTGGNRSTRTERCPCPFDHNKSHMNCPVIKPGPCLRLSSLRMLSSTHACLCRCNDCVMGWMIQGSMSFFTKTSRPANHSFVACKATSSPCYFSTGSSHVTIREEYTDDRVVTWPVQHYAPQIIVVCDVTPCTDVSKEPAASIFATMRAPNITFFCRVSEVNQFRPSIIRESRVCYLNFCLFCADRKYAWLVGFKVKGTAADTTDAPQPWGLLCNPVKKMISFFRFSL